MPVYRTSFDQPAECDGHYVPVDFAAMKTDPTVVAAARFLNDRFRNAELVTLRDMRDALHTHYGLTLARAFDLADVVTKCDLIRRGSK